MSGTLATVAGLLASPARHPPRYRKANPGSDCEQEVLGLLAFGYQ